MIPNIVGTSHKRVGTKFIGGIAGTGDNTKTRLITLVVPFGLIVSPWSQAFYTHP
jgi:hypothetical protein